MDILNVVNICNKAKEYMSADEYKKFERRITNKAMSIERKYKEQQQELRASYLAGEWFILRVYLLDSNIELKLIVNILKNKVDVK